MNGLALRCSGLARVQVITHRATLPTLGKRLRAPALQAGVRPVNLAQRGAEQGVHFFLVQSGERWVHWVGVGDAASCNAAPAWAASCGTSCGPSAGWRRQTV